MDLNICEYEYENRISNLNIKALGEVKSEKFFPVFRENGEEFIFKPLSKTKPFLTYLFAYSEVYWSNIINKYFDINTPFYRLAICHGCSDMVAKYYDKGTIISKIDTDGERLVNLLEFFRENPDEKVSIDKYINYCGVFYDYTSILDSDFFKGNRLLGEKLAYQILLSILKGDINYHYENVFLLYKDGKPVDIAPMIDHEFSSMFFCLDYLSMHKKYMSKIISSISFQDIKDDNTMAFNIQKNLDYIICNYPDVVKRFQENIRKLKNDIKDSPIIFKNNGFIEPFNSYEFLVGRARYKENNEEKAKYIEKNIDRNVIDLMNFSKCLNSEVIDIILSLERTITKRLNEKVKCIRITY